MTTFTVRRFQLFVAIAVIGLLQIGNAEAKPNVVFFLVDDLGYMDIEPNNPKTFYETPNINRIAKRGMRFTNGYAANPVCSPTRYSIMTGKYPSRVDATNFFAGKRSFTFNPAPLNDRMPLSEVTLAEAFRDGGYRTAFLGKWHLGPTEEFWPEKQGFEFNVGGHHRGSPPGGYFAPFKNPRLEDREKGEHLPARLTEEALKIVDEVHESPFLLYLSFYSVHTPLQAPKELIEKYRKKAERLGLADKQEFKDEEQAWPGKRPRKVRILQKHAIYAAMMESMDTAIGNVLDKLEDLGIADNTVICFMSDNGGLSTSEGSPTSNLPLRGGKGWLYEGGIREPYIISWPGVTDAAQICDVPVVSCDFYPTLLDIAGLPMKPEQHLDGVSLVPLLKGSDTIERDVLYWHYPHYSNQGGHPGGAIRVGDFKLIEHYVDGEVRLYNLKNDLGEQNNLAESMPDKANSMRQKLHTWYKTVDAKFLQQKPGGPKPWRP